MRIAQPIELDEQATHQLCTLSRGRRVQQRARIILLAAQGWQNKRIADRVGLDRRQVALWHQRFAGGGIDALLRDAPRSGRPPSVMAQMQSRIVQATLHERPASATH